MFGTYKTPLRVTLLFRPKAPNQAPGRDIDSQALHHSNDGGSHLKEMSFLASVSPVNNAQVKFKFGDRKETTEMLPGDLLATPLGWLR